MGSWDLKIVAMALVSHALLLSANLSDFERVPGFAGRELAGLMERRGGKARGTKFRPGFNPELLT